MKKDQQQEREQRGLKDSRLRSGLKSQGFPGPLKGICECGYDGSGGFQLQNVLFSIQSAAALTSVIVFDSVLSVTFQGRGDITGPNANDLHFILIC